jgi:hypothetical protein
MTHPLSDDQVRLLRAGAQGLGAERPRAGVAETVRRVPSDTLLEDVETSAEYVLAFCDAWSGHWNRKASAASD